VTGGALAVAGRAVAQQQNFDTVQIDTVKVRDNVYMLVGAGGNTTVFTGDEGLLVVDTQFAPLSTKILTAIRAISQGPIRYVVSTHLHGDHIGGNEAISKAGRTRAGGNVVGDLGAGATGQAVILAHENVLTRLSAPPAAGQQQVAFGLWPTETFFGKKREFLFNGEAVQIIHEPKAHTDGDSLVFFRKSDVVATGDIFRTDSYPVIDLPKGGSVQGIIDGLNRVLDLAVPAHHEEGGTFIVPGHGRICDEFDVLEYRDMVTIVRDRVQAMKAKGMTVEQVKAARPTLDYDARYGASTGAWTTDMFVDAVYRSVVASR